MAWDIPTKKRLNTFPELDCTVATASCFYGSEREFVVGGSSCSPKIIPIDQEVTIGGRK